jgi:hypothetical protein
MVEKQFLLYKILLEDSGDAKENDYQFLKECCRLQEQCFQDSSVGKKAQRAIENPVSGVLLSSDPLSASVPG